MAKRNHAELSRPAMKQLLGCASKQHSVNMLQSSETRDYTALVLP
jgi:hypothetical protein